MASKDILQSSKEFSNRKSRIKARKIFDDQERSKLTEIEDINSKIKDLELAKKRAENEYNEIKEEKFHTLSMMYNDSDLIKDIVNYGKHTTYSRSIITDIENTCNTGVNEDCVDLELIEKISSLEEKINIEIKHTNCIADILANFGNGIDIPGEDGE